MGGRGRIYAIGVGPGDPEYMTLKACRIIRECDVVAVPVPDRSPGVGDCGMSAAEDGLPAANGCKTPGAEEWTPKVYVCGKLKPGAGDGLTGAYGGGNSKPWAGDQLPGADRNEKPGTEDLTRNTYNCVRAEADPRCSAAYRIAAAAVPELNDKKCIGLSMPMIRDRSRLYAYHRAAAERLEGIMDQGKSIAYLALGDVTLYCTFSYLQSILEEDGYKVCLISGVSSLSAAAARLNMPLATGNEQLHVLPGIYFAGGTGAKPGARTGEVHEIRPKDRPEQQVYAEDDEPVAQPEYGSEPQAQAEGGPEPQVYAGTDSVSRDENYKTGMLPGLYGTCVIMKSGRCMKDVKRAVAESGKLAAAVENCGMADEHIYYGLDEIPDDAGYFTTVIVKDR